MVVTLRAVGLQRRAWCRTSPTRRRRARRRRRTGWCRSRHACRSGRVSRAAAPPAGCGPRPRPCAACRSPSGLPEACALPFVLADVATGWSAGAGPGGSVAPECGRGAGRWSSVCVLCQQFSFWHAAAIQPPCHGRRRPATHVFRSWQPEKTWVAGRLRRGRLFAGHDTGAGSPPVPQNENCYAAGTATVMSVRAKSPPLNSSGMRRNLARA